MRVMNIGVCFACKYGVNISKQPFIRHTDHLLLTNGGGAHAADDQQLCTVYAENGTKKTCLMHT